MRIVSFSSPSLLISLCIYTHIHTIPAIFVVNKRYSLCSLHSNYNLNTVKEERKAEETKKIMK